MGMANLCALAALAVVALQGCSTPGGPTDRGGVGGSTLLGLGGQMFSSVATLAGIAAPDLGPELFTAAQGVRAATDVAAAVGRAVQPTADALPDADVPAWPAERMDAIDPAAAPPAVAAAAPCRTIALHSLDGGIRPSTHCREPDGLPLVEGGDAVEPAPALR